LQKIYILGFTSASILKSMTYSYIFPCVLQRDYLELPMRWSRNAKR